MATVRVLDQEEMEDIRDDMIVNAVVNGSGHLIFTQHDGTIIDAGYVMGSATPDAVAATPETLVKRDSAGRTKMAPPVYDDEVAIKATTQLAGTSAEDPNTIVRRDSVGEIKAARLRLSSTGDADPVSTAHALQIGPSNDKNMILDPNEIMVRNGDGTITTLYSEGGFAAIAGWSPTSATHMTPKSYVDDLVTGVAIPAATNLNIYTAGGTWFQPSNANAASGSNYPAPNAGFLEVINGQGTIYQRYTVYGNPAVNSQQGQIFIRSYTSGAWTAWKWAGGGDTGEVTSGIATAATGWSIGSQFARKVGPFCSLYFVVTYSGTTITVPATGDITNETIGQLTANYIPSATQAQPLSHIGTGRSTSFYLTASGGLGMSATAPGANIASGASWTFGGMVLL